ncbi:MAG: HNH endonuclease [Tannerella sp.]|jgi:hypothetical protein|nr:HNH endonuclease [Tannerella sp.]
MTIEGFWTRERDEELKRLYPDMLTREIAEIFGCSIYGIRKRAGLFRLKKSREFVRETARMRSLEPGHGSRKSRFPKGHIPFNRGKRQTEYMSPEMIERVKSTGYRRGHVPHNARPAGYERLDREGYVLIKVEGRRRLVSKHRWIWEQHHGIVPKGWNIQFRDGNRQNCDIDNLYVISRSEQIHNNSIMRYPKEIRKAIRNIHKLNKCIKNHETN